MHHLSGKQITSYGPQAGLANAPVSSILVVASGNVFVGNENGGLTQLIGNKFASLDPAAVLGGVPVRALYEDGAGRLWIGTQGKGLACEKNGRVTVWDVKAGFPDNEISGILADYLGRLWINTRSGVLVLFSAAGNFTNGALPELEMVKEYEESSLGAVSRGWPQAVKSSDGHLWFAGPQSLNAFDPHDFHAATPLFPVELETILVNGQPLNFRNTFGVMGQPDAKNPLRLPSNMRTLEFSLHHPLAGCAGAGAISTSPGSFRQGLGGWGERTTGSVQWPAVRAIPVSRAGQKSGRHLGSGRLGDV